MIVGVDAGFSRSTGFLGKRTMSLDASWWTHAFIRFRFDDRAPRIFESLISTKGFTESDPSHYDLAALVAAKKETALVAVFFVPLLEAPDDPRLYTALALCEQWIGAKTYPKWQLVSLWLAHRYGVPVPVSEDALICSEALAVIAFELGIDLRDIWHPVFDSVTPGSAWNNLMAIWAGYGSQILRKKEAKVCGAGYSKYYSLRPRRP